MQKRIHFNFHLFTKHYGKNLSCAASQNSLVTKHAKEKFFKIVFCLYYRTDFISYSVQWTIAAYR